MQDEPERKKLRKKRPLWHFLQQLKGRGGSWACPAQSRISGSLGLCGQCKTEREFLSLVLNGAGAALCQPSDTIPAF